MKNKKILVPIDFSECSIGALRVAINMAKLTQSRLLLMHTYHVPASFSDTTIPDLYEYARKKAEEEFVELKIKVPELNEVPYDFKTDYALAADVINLYTKNHEVDLIVMGTTGATGLDEILIGSITYDVVKGANCPVLAIPISAETTDFKNIALAADYEEVPDRQIFEPLISLASNYDSRIHILNVSKSTVIADNDSMQARKFEHYFNHIQHSYNYELEEDVEEGINAYLKNHDVDMLAIIRRQHNLVDRLFKKNITKKMVYHTHVPLLVLPEIQ